MQGHCQRSNIITTENEGRKKKVCGCFEQLLINKTTLGEFTENRHSLIIMWVGYQKGCDSVPHKLLIKVIEKIITAIKTLMKK